MAVKYKSMLVFIVVWLGCFVVRAKISVDDEQVSSEDAMSEEDETFTLPAGFPRVVKVQPFAFPGSAPEICPSSRCQCGFQIYDKLTREPDQPFIKYCNCPEGSYCVKSNANVNMKFFYYRCKENLEDGDETVPTYYIITASIVYDTADFGKVVVPKRFIRMELIEDGIYVARRISSNWEDVATKLTTESVSDTTTDTSTRGDRQQTEDTLEENLYDTTVQSTTHKSQQMNDLTTEAVYIVTIPSTRSGSQQMDEPAETDFSTGGSQQSEDISIAVESCDAAAAQTTMCEGQQMKTSTIETATIPSVRDGNKRNEDISDAELYSGSSTVQSTIYGIPQTEDDSAEVAFSTYTVPSTTDGSQQIKDESVETAFGTNKDHDTRDFYDIGMPSTESPDSYITESIPYFTI